MYKIWVIGFLQRKETFTEIKRVMCLSKTFKGYNATLCSISRKNKYPVLYPTLSPKIKNKMWPFCCSFIHWNPCSSPFHSPIQEVEEGLKHHMVACLVGVMQFGCVQGDGGPWRVSYTLKIHKHTILAGYHSAEQKQFVTIFQATAAPPTPTLYWIGDCLLVLGSFCIVYCGVMSKAAENKQDGHTHTEIPALFWISLYLAFKCLKCMNYDAILRNCVVSEGVY